MISPLHKNVIDLAGRQFGRLVAVEDADGFAGKCAVHSFHTFGFNSCEQWKGA